MITLESKLEAVAGGNPQRVKKMQTGLGLRTVGDLLRHFPRRYLETGSLTKVGDLRVGQMLVVVGEIEECKRHTYQDKRTRRNAYRVEAVLRTGGPRLRMTFFAKNPGTAAWHERRVAQGNRGVFIGRADRFRDQWQLVNPAMTIFGQADSTAEDEGGIPLGPEEIGPLFPIYPLTKGIESWDLGRAVRFALTMVDDLPELLPDDVREQYGVLDVATAYRWIHR